MTTAEVTKANEGIDGIRWNILACRPAPSHRAIIRKVFPAVEDAGAALSGALMNAGLIIHPPLIVMNAGPIEHLDQFDIHKAGTQPAIRRVTNHLDEERVAAREAARRISRCAITLPPRAR
jgi:opine dehydrogenase